MKILITSGVLALFLCIGAHAQIPPEQAREIVAKFASKIVTVKVVTKTTTAMDGREADKEEQDTEATGIVIHPSGLAALSLSMIEPMSGFQDMIEAFGGSSDSINIQTEVSDIKIRFPDGKEVAGIIAMRDRDLDLVFVRPKEKLETQKPYVDLELSGDALQMDKILLLSRLGKMGNWTSVARTTEINGILTKPRKMYLISSDNIEEMGSLAVTADNKALGIVLLRKVRGAGKDEPEAYTVILPARDILSVAKQITERADGD